MITMLSDPFDALFNLQRALDARLASEWLSDATTSRGPFPPINVFQQGDDILAIIELPGIDKEKLQIEAKENTIRIQERKRQITRMERACIDASVTSGNSTALSQFPSNSIPTASRRNIVTAY